MSRETTYGYGADAAQQAAAAMRLQQAMCGAPKETPPEELLSRCLKEDLGITVNPQALRVFLRWRWDRVQTLAHRIHE